MKITGYISYPLNHAIDKHTILHLKMKNKKGVDRERETINEFSTFIQLEISCLPLT